MTNESDTLETREPTNETEARPAVTTPVPWATPADDHVHLRVPRRSFFWGGGGAVAAALFFGGFATGHWLVGGGHHGGRDFGSRIERRVPNNRGQGPGQFSGPRGRTTPSPQTSPTP